MLRKNKEKVKCQRTLLENIYYKSQLPAYLSALYYQPKRPILCFIYTTAGVCAIKLVAHVTKRQRTLAVRTLRYRGRKTVGDMRSRGQIAAMMNDSFFFYLFSFFRLLCQQSGMDIESICSRAESGE